MTRPDPTWRAGITALHAFDTRLDGWVQTGFTGSKVLLIACAQLEEHFAESLVVLAVLAVGGVLYRVFRRVPRRSTAAAPGALPEARVVGDPQA